MGKIIKKEFYEKDTLTVAKNLLGKILCRKMPNGEIYKGKIIEVEAYTQDEPSCHGFGGVTKRNSVMFQSGGVAYVYFTYGMYHCLNIITDKEGFASGVLIRATEPFEGNFKNTNGPAKLCRELNITKELNGCDICNETSGLWIETARKIPAEEIVATERIGIKKAVELPWRFYIKNNKFVSKK